MALTEAQKDYILQAIFDIFDGDPAIFRTSMEAIRVNTDAVTIDNQITELRKQKQAYDEQIEAQIQELLNMR